MDVAGGPQKLSIEVIAEDARYIVEGLLRVAYDRPDGTKIYKDHAIYYFELWPPDGCSPRSGTYAGGIEVEFCSYEIVFDVEDPAGSWHIVELSLKDSVGNLVGYGPSDFEAMGIDSTFEVLGGTSDLDPPVLTGLNFNTRSLDVAGGPQKLSIEVIAEDASDIVEGLLRLRMTVLMAMIYKDPIYYRIWPPDGCSPRVGLTRVVLRLSSAVMRLCLMWRTRRAHGTLPNYR